MKVQLVILFLVVNRSFVKTEESLETNYKNTKGSDLKCEEKHHTGSTIECASVCATLKDSHLCMALKMTGSNTCSFCNPCGSGRQTNWTSPYFIIQFDSSREEFNKG